MNRTYLVSLLLALFTLISTGCSEKNYFSPKKVDGKIVYDGTLPAKIVEVGYHSATLENGEVITDKGVSSYHVPKGYRYITQSGNLVVAQGDCRPTILLNTETNSSETINLGRPLVAGLLMPEDNMLAFLIEGNSYGLYNYKERRVVAKYRSDTALTADIRIASPILLDQLLLIPTLDGKVVILNRHTGAKIREIIVGKGEVFNNIIFLNILGNRLVAATPHRIISVSPKLMDAQVMEISDVLFMKDSIYILSKDGTIYHCDTDLKIVESKKFPFAHFVGAISGEFIYLIEKEGYVIAITPDFSSYHILKLPEKIDGWFLATKDRLYYDQYYFKLHR
jgi:hypothetical protein